MNSQENSPHSQSPIWYGRHSASALDMQSALACQVISIFVELFKNLIGISIMLPICRLEIDIGQTAWSMLLLSFHGELVKYKHYMKTADESANYF